MSKSSSDPATDPSKERLSADDTRQAMLDAGLAMLVAEGLTPSVEHLTLERAVRAADVPRSSAYNAWTGYHGDVSPQAAFQRELMRHAIETGPAAKGMDLLFAEARTILEQAEELGAEVVRAQLIRVAGEAHYHQCATDKTLIVGIAMFSVAHSTSSTSAGAALATDVIAWAKAAEDDWRDRLIKDVFQPLISFLDLEPNPTLAGPRFWEQFVTSLNAFGAGLLPRIDYTDSDITTVYRPGHDGGLQRWSLFSVGLEALIEHYFQPRGRPSPR